MQQCIETITIFNSYTDPATKYKKYLSTIITGVSWFGEAQALVSQDGLLSADLYTIRIPIDADFSDKSYLSPKEFEKIPNDKMINYWTISQGDIIIRGAVTDSGDSAKPAKLEDKYDDVITILSVTDNRNKPSAKHWKVVCK